MESKNDSVIGNELNIFSNISDMLVKVGTIKLSKNDLKSEVSLIKVLQQASESLDKGTYTLDDNNSLFARFDLEKGKILSRHNKNQNLFDTNNNSLKITESQSSGNTSSESSNSKESSSSDNDGAIQADF